MFRCHLNSTDMITPMNIAKLNRMCKFLEVEYLYLHYSEMHVHMCNSKNGWISITEQNQS